MTQDIVECTVGIDWGNEFHQVCVLDVRGECRGERQFPQSAAGLTELVTWLREQTGLAAGQIRVAIERPHGPVVEVLLQHEFQVYHINPKQLGRFRDRHTVAGAKDDRRDAFVLADSLRTDRGAFTALQSGDPTLVQLRGLLRIDEDLRTEENVLTNRLRELLQRYFPAMLSLIANRADPFLWSLLELAPTPQKAAGLSLTKIGALLKEHRVRRHSAVEVQTALQSVPLAVSEATIAAASFHVGLLIPGLRLVHQQRRLCSGRLEEFLAQLESPEPVEHHKSSGRSCKHPDPTILASLPGVGRMVLATLLVEAAGPIAGRDLAGLRALGGIAPVTKRSGKRNLQVMRRACNTRLRYAFYHWGRTATQRDSHAKHHYAQLRQKGHSHGRALRGVVDRLLSVAVAMLKQDTCYDPARRQRTKVVLAAHE